ncbi:trithorax group protein osa-like [Schistocerca serialis cubense]|uniref:trithorax group protein osa-like n=1 Tax=Schistocerca serialis cubense TaxID=2023355 RepID=UPI00214F3362|nr:trithorax group protein osa-like [Schistocerca serialis cubense]
MGQEFNQQYSPSSSYPPARPMYPPYASETERSYGQGRGTQQSAGGQDPFGHNRYGGPSQPPGYPSRTGYSAPPMGPPAQQPTGYPPQQDYYRQDPVYSGQQAATATGPGGQMYPGSPHSKSMPPPAPQTPRRHPDFAKDPQQSPYPPYSQQRPSIYGWSSGNTQYRAQYPPQGPVPQGPPQWNQNAQRAGGPEPGQPANSQWDQHRYQASGQSPYQPPQQQQWVPSMQTPGINQNSLLRPPMVSPRAPFRPEGKPYSMQQLPGSKAQPPGMNNAQVYQQQSAPKREIVFPPESVEAILPVLYKRKRMTRGDVAPVEAWRLMMSLRSGLLAESAWALDILNILLFDDSTVAYFGLAHMPGLLDVLLEHFRRSLADMFDSPLPDSVKKWFQAPKVETPEVDLGQVRVPVDPADHITLMKSTPNYTLVTRNGEVVRIVNRDNEIFVVDNRKSWDIEGDLAENYDVVQDPWQLTSSDISSTKYIVSCFQGEFGNVPFARLLDDSKTVGAEEEEDCRTKVSEEESYPIENLSVTPPIVLKVECSDDNGVIDSSSSASNVILNEEHLIKDSSFVDVQDSDEVKRTKTILSDVFSRIKTENTEENSLLPEHCVDPLEPPKETVEVKKEANCVESESSSNYERELPHSPNVPKDIETKSDNAVSETSDTNNFSSSNIKTEHTNNDNSSNSNEKMETEMEQDVFLEGSEHEGKDINMEDDYGDEAEEKSKVTDVRPEIKGENRGGIQIRDPAGTLKRRRMSDYEDECYARDEASLYLVTDTQDAKARRCVCLSTILRNLTFVPGNEAEFAKNVTFLDLLGKLLLLHHEHPPRAQKQRNYDREEDADFADSCSSLQGEAEWWWDFLHHVRENVLVTAANIAGHMDLGQHPEEVSRPVIDGLLHWAVCPAAHGQDPFPGSSGSLSPQRLALEALCKLCVTDSNVDLVVATPPYSRLERLCAVLTRLLCWSKEQVLREFAVNMLHYLAAADSGVARTVALQSPCVSLLVAFIEQAEATALGVAYQHGIGALIDNPDAMGTSLDMLRRAAGTLLHLARHPENRPLFLQQEQRLLSLVMSQILDQQVAAVISSVLFQCSWPSS